MEYASFLRKHIGEIVALSDEEFNLILPFFSYRTINKKEYLIREGQTVHSEFFVLKGLLKAFMSDESGKEFIVQFAMENWWISDYPAYKIQGKGDLCVQALEDCVVLELSLENKNRICGLVPKMQQFHGTKAFNGFVALQKRVLSLMRNSASEKYELLLEQYPALFQRVSKTMIAHYLGVSRETLSRLSHQR
ncbi:Crp/Fnr family transcriptional regulator [Sediminibacterium ginsengisoli]|uniref:cAMP-binding domain of CRP or a regulatory subunit of cAMP-dependent protein kinases n=1 Tax=Sediminibacterium ginsengisoli TaxID=413434 RepID=A0A1T4LAF6_9BACT|nr:Crp/Fnr family transcriptional regulator [Sediminibacterium ginsengisoli]SJZ51600.1 cAMP-binding domain of CRP or a regulatory subunit of cAMP-dependent protein kinases [Sediminibacterium ginsengisoli]